MIEPFDETAGRQNNNLMIKLVDESHLMKQPEGETII
jgi:hypothetical protein